MAGKASTFANEILKLIFNATPIANIADNAASSPLTNLYLSLHNADPGANNGNSQAAGEILYTGYQRIALQRSATGWTVSGNSVSPTTQVQFGEKTGGDGGTASWVGVGTESGKLLYSGQLDPPIIVTQNGTIPTIKTSSTIREL